MGPDAAEYPGGGVAGPATAALGVVAAGVASGPAPMPIICCTVEGPAPRGPTVPGIIFIPSSIGTWPAVPGIIVAAGVVPAGHGSDTLRDCPSGPAPMPIIRCKAEGSQARGPTVPGIILAPPSIGTWPAVPGIVAAVPAAGAGAAAGFPAAGAGAAAGFPAAGAMGPVSQCPVSRSPTQCWGAPAGTVAPGL